MRNIYLYIVAAIFVLGFFMPQKGEKRKYYILVITLLHIFVSGFRYYHLTGDLMKYHYTFNIMGSADWFSETIKNDWKNTGFMLFLKAVYMLSDAEFQAVIFIIAVIIQLILAYTIYRYSPAPWMSFLVWDCMSFYIFGFSAIKQAFAMSFIMLSTIGILEKRPRFYLCMIALATFIHMPALVFLPAYWFCQLKMKPGTIMMYVLMGFTLFIFKDQFVNFIKLFYYEDDEVFIYSGELGSRFIMILGFALFSILLSGFENPNLEKLVHVIAIAAMLQMLAGFDNIFTRLTDYYFQLSVLYLPMLFFRDNQPVQVHTMRAVFPFNARSRKVMALILCMFMLWFYYTYSINIEILSAVDDYTNYRFMWDVK